MGLEDQQLQSFPVKAVPGLFQDMQEINIESMLALTKEWEMYEQAFVVIAELSP